MRRCVLIVMLMVCVLGLTSCGNISDKVTQKLNTIEVGEDFDINSFFEVEEGIAISLKDTDIDMSAIGSHSIDLIISDGKKEEEKTFTVNVVDTQAPVIKTRDITLYEGLKFHAEEFATVSDNSGEDISATVKNSNVDTSTAGEYYVTYEAIDSSGNSTEKTATVEVRLLNSSKDVMDVVDQYLTEERLSGYEKKDITLDGQDLLESVCVTSPKLSNTVIEKCREVTMCPEIHIDSDMFNSSSDYPNGKFGVSGILLKFEFTDSHQSELDRIILYPRKKITISSGDYSFNNGNDYGPDGEFGYFENTSNLFYFLNHKEIEKLEKMLNKGTVKFMVRTYYEDIDLDRPLLSIKKPYSFVYKLNKSDIKQFKITMKIYHYLVDVMGKNPYS